MGPLRPDAIHIIADFSDCQAELLEHSHTGEMILQKAIESSGLSCVLIRSHQFKPSGYTAAALLTESHITLHTWPEHQAVQIDIFTCGSHDKARKAYDKLKDEFKPGQIAEKILFRRLNSLAEA
ncbi:MAG TPA: adenosylmethionine decarboxylase [Candidatus Rifleibacterium sp.]|nr:adenosylmethionine decarboxylase [Candidatus Rifleibacterium sp.]HPW58112.1 adenosylmethionine decarboxylase [Candidatus Rifleibacterium sp.]